MVRLKTSGYMNFIGVKKVVDAGALLVLIQVIKIRVFHDPF